MRYLIKYTKESEVKFIAHLDLMRTIQKTVRRAQLPASYSKGFNPHLALSIAQPLSVGVYSSGEYADLVLTEEVDEQEIVDRLNAKSAMGIRFLTATKIVNIENEKKLPQAMALIDACSYVIKVKYNNTEKLEEEINNLLAEEEWVTIKKSKRGESEVDIKSLVYQFEFKVEDDVLEIHTLIQSGSREHLSADLLVNYIKEHTTGVNENAFVDIKREDMYFLKDGKYVPLSKVR
ncbi:MAG: TIGR03936 family radical SAM-associated protein [Clostridiaceae bacterium]|nr:TIGR03936 family radical SAM-associated protein [Clostridiaceae bacterium]